MKSAGTTAPQCCELYFNYFTVLLTGCSSNCVFSRVFLYFSPKSARQAAVGFRENRPVIRPGDQNAFVMGSAEKNRYRIPFSYGIPSAFGAREFLEVKARTIREMI